MPESVAIAPQVVLTGLLARQLTLHLAIDASWKELQAPGYHPRLLRWTQTNGAAQAAPETFVFGGPSGLIYGYFVSDLEGTILVRSPLLDDLRQPIVIRVAGDEIIVTARLVAA